MMQKSPSRTQKCMLNNEQCCQKHDKAGSADPSSGSGCPHSAQMAQKY